MNAAIGVLLPPLRREALALRARAQRWGVVAGLYTLVTVCLCATLARTDTEVARLTAQRQAAEERVKSFKAALASTRARMQAQQTRLRASEIVSQHPNWSILMRRVSVLRGDSAVFDRFEIVPTSQGRDLLAGPSVRAPGSAAQESKGWYTIILAGKGRSHQAVTEMLQRFEAEKLFEKVELGQMSSAEAGLVRFNVTCTLGEGSVREERAR